MSYPSPTRPKPYPQGDGSWAQWLNCVLASTTMLIHRSTIGRLRPPAWKLRNITGDKVGGVTLQQAADAAAKAGEPGLEPRYNLTRLAVRAIVRSGRGIVIIINCAVTVNTKRATNRFMGLHAVYVNDWRWINEGSPIANRRMCACERDTGAPHGEYLVEDPGTTAAGFLWWSAPLLHRAAEARVGAPAGAPAINVLVGPDTEGVDRKARLRGVIRAEPQKNSKRLGHTVRGKTYRVRHTTNGSTWVAPDGELRDNWARIPEGWVRGEVIAA